MTSPAYEEAQRRLALIRAREDNEARARMHREVIERAQEKARQYTRGRKS